jgi:serine/threonine protein kinase
LLGEGGIARVFKAVNTQIDRLVAIKILKPEMSGSQELVERFLREGRTANRVRHPNVVEVFDVATTNEGVPFLVQELLVGETLHAYMQRKQNTMSLLQIVERIVPIVDAIAYAHECGVVHRDIKPENIYLKHDRDLVVPKVLDFGISKVRDQNVRTTATGVVVGTPAYMAPEVIMYDPAADGRVDQWSVGVLLYEMLAGRLPFESQSVSALFVEICSKPIRPIRELVPELSEDIAWIVHRCLEKEPDKRFGSMTALSDALCDAIGIARTGRRRRDVFRSAEDPDSGNAEVGGERSAPPALSVSEADRLPSQKRVLSQPTPAQLEATGESVRPPLSTAAEPRAKRSKVLLGTLLVAVVGVAALYAINSRRSRPAEISSNGLTAGATSRGINSDAASAPPASSVRFEIVSHHRGAEVALRGRSYPAPVSVSVSPSNDEEVVTVSAPGFVSRALSLVLDQSMSLTIDLEAAGDSAAITTDAAPEETLPTDSSPTLAGRRLLRGSRGTALNARGLHAARPEVVVGNAANAGSPALPTTVAITPPVSATTVTNRNTNDASLSHLAAPTALNTAATATPTVAPAVTLTRAQVRQVASANQGGLQECADRARSEDPSLSGRLMFRISIAGTGRVESVLQVGGTTSNAPLAHCLTSAMARWQFPATGTTRAQDVLFPVDLD